MYCTFFSPRSIFDLQTASNCCLLQFFNAFFFIAFQNLTYVQNPSYPTAESGSTAMSCVYVVNAVASAPGKKNLCQIIKINYKKFNLSVYESCSLQSQRENPNSCGSVSEINLYHCSKSIQNHASSLYQFNSTFEMNHKENL